MDKKLLKAVRALEEPFAKSDMMGLRGLSNDFIGEAAMENNRMLAELAMIGYCLHKLGTKTHIAGHGKWFKVKKRVLVSLEKAAKAIEENDLKKFEETLKGIVREIKEIDLELGNFVRGIYEKAAVKYAADAYALGLSLSQAAQLTGANKSNVLDYIGATKISDREERAIGIGERLKRLKKSL